MTKNNLCRGQAGSRQGAGGSGGGVLGQVLL